MTLVQNFTNEETAYGHGRRQIIASSHHPLSSRTTSLAD
jgi:hypothetical protein